METVQQQIERWKATAQIFLDKQIRTFIRDANGDLYFCIVAKINEESLIVQCFGPRQRAGQLTEIFWPLIVSFERYEERVEAVK